MYQEIYNQLEGIQKFIFIFWSICFSLFVLSFIDLVVYSIKLKIYKIK